MTDREVMQQALWAIEESGHKADLMAAADALRARIADREQATPEQIDAARQLYAEGSEGDIAVDDDAFVSRTETGAWVQAWVFVSNEEDAA